MENIKKQPRIILNCLPPAHLHMPSPGLSILKSVLNLHHFSAEIIYWNIKFEHLLSEWSDLFVEESFESGRIIPFVYALARKYNDDAALNKISDLMQILYGEKKTNKKPGWERHLSKLTDKTFNKLNDFFDEEFNAFNFEGVILSGFSSKFYQWIPAIQLAELTKKSHPGIKTIIGGFDSKESAAETLRMFGCFDFAVWGEGEYPLLELTNTLCDGGHQFNDVSALVYREGNQVRVSERKNRKFLDLDNYPKADFDDFFAVSKEDVDKGEYKYYPVETNRGCYWNQCKFCVLGNGYKYRERNIESVMDEIQTAVNKYDCGYFQFLDNNVIGCHRERIEMLLDKLIEYYIVSDNDFSFFGEILPYGLDAAFYKKLSLAGFRMVQIGGESFSESLIRKMKKRNSFSDNLLGYKFCIKYGIRAEGANIITGIPGETLKDIRECTTNAHFIRFFTGGELIKFEESPFALDKLSKFYRELSKEEIGLYLSNYVFNLLPKAITDEMNRFELFSFGKRPNPQHEKLWAKFFKRLNLYFNTPFTYKIFRFGETIIYEEFHAKVKVAALVFDKPEQWEILVIANNRLMSFTDMLEKLQMHYDHVDDSILKRMLDELKMKFLLYFDDNYGKIISVIDTDLIL
jgi:radical SAM superfamily enzyme YgiQ (UPF0313 family)